MRLRSGFCAVVVFGVGAGGAWAGVIQSTFDAGLEGWIISNTIGVQWMGAGGNPGGYAHIDNSEAQVAYMFAPAAFLGDLSAYDGGALSFDAIQIVNMGGPWDNFENFGRVRIIGPTLSASLDLVPGTSGPAPTWTTYSAPLSAATWGLSEGDWQTLLAEVTQISISVEGVFGDEVNGVDNVRILSADAMPCGPADLAEPFGTLDFSDVFEFLIAFQGMESAADLAEPTGVWDFSDVFEFLILYSNGCP